MEHFTLVMVTTGHLARVTTAPTATTRSIIKLSAGSYTSVGDLYAMGPRCSICAEIEIPFAEIADGDSAELSRESAHAEAKKH